MAAGRTEKGSSAGLSLDTADVAAIFERLKEEVRERQVGASGAGAGGQLAARTEAERLWPVAVDVAVERRPGLRGRAVYAGKRVLGRLMSWYVGPFALEQRSFNYQVLQLVDELAARTEQALRRVDELEAASSRVDEVAERLLRLEQALRRP